MILENIPVHNLNLTGDLVLRAQGSDPEVIRKRKPMLHEIAEWAVKEGEPLLDPKVIQKTYQVNRLVHNKLELSSIEGKKHYYLSGSLIIEHLALAEKVTVSVCTIGDSLELLAAELMQSDPLHGWALDSFGSAAVESLAEFAFTRMESLAREEGKYTSVPLSPGMVNWPLEVGQYELFRMIDPSTIGVHINDNFLMSPGKSLSFVTGNGREISNSGTTCDYCAVNDTCQYQDHYIQIKD